MIHVDFPVHFVREWLSVSDKHDVGARESARGEYALRGRGKFESSRDHLSARLYASVSYRPLEPHGRFDRERSCEFRHDWGRTERRPAPRSPSCVAEPRRATHLTVE